MSALRPVSLVVGLGLVLGLSACSGLARDTATYQADTSALLDTRTAELQACYNRELRLNRDAIGTLTVRFVVEKESGRVTQLEWDRNHSTVSDTLATCALGALEGLRLAEPDQRDGEATFRFSFRGSVVTAD